jgi:hypothetical protein
MTNLNCCNKFCILKSAAQNETTRRALWSKAAPLMESSEKLFSAVIATIYNAKHVCSHPTETAAVPDRELPS